MLLQQEIQMTSYNIYTLYASVRVYARGDHLLNVWVRAGQPVLVLGSGSHPTAHHVSTGDVGKAARE
jgi:hypothetical protein